jgi:3-hydroxypropanoate dehydrogenase
LLTSPERVQMVQGMLKTPGLTETVAMRNGSLQDGYLILAARALGLDCWPMSGFDNDEVDREFLPERTSSRTSSAASVMQTQS